MINENRIPTILGLLLIAVSLGATVFLFNNARNFFSQANIEASPEKVRISNLSSKSFTVSWLTPVKASGAVNYGIEKLDNVVVEKRDNGGKDQYFVHHVTLNFLQPNTKYRFEIISGGKSFNNGGESFTVKTLENISKENQAAPAYGKVLQADNTPATETLVYLSLGTGFLYSTLTKSSGNWLISFLSNQPAAPEEKIDLTFQNETEVSSVITTADKLSPVSEIVLGKNYDFRVLGISTFKFPNPLSSGVSVVEAATPSAAPASPTPTPTPLIFASPTATPSTAPASGNLTPTFFLLLISLTLIVLGTGKLVLLDTSN